MAELLFQGHGSYRIVWNDGTVVYVDPYVGEGYDLPADFVLITHEHGDHNAISRVCMKPDTRVIRAAEALEAGLHRPLQNTGCMKVTGVLASNKNHDPARCVGFVIEAEGIRLYASGDTSHTEDMDAYLPQQKLDVALLPTDGVYNMNAEEASDCARKIGARINIPIHTKPGQLFDRKVAQKFTAEGRHILEPGETLVL